MKRISEVQKCQVNVHLILIQGDKILMMRRANTGFKDGMYSLSAGKLDRGETVYEALVREAKEEVGIDVSFIGNDWLKATNVLHRYSKEGTVAMDFFLRTHQFSGIPKNMEPGKCDEVVWMTLDSMPENTIPYVKKGVLNSLQGLVLDEYIWE